MATNGRLTPAQRRALEALTPDMSALIAGRRHVYFYRSHGKPDGIVNRRTFTVLRDHGFIGATGREFVGQMEYRITDAGRAALAADGKASEG